MDQGTERVVDDFVMDAVAGARRTPWRHKNGGETPKPPATIRLSVAPVFWDFGSFYQRRCGVIFLRAVAAAVIFVLSLVSRHKPGRNRIPDVLQLPTLRRHVPRAVAAGVSLSFLPMHGSHSMYFICNFVSDSE